MDKGVDVSKYQGVIDWAKVKADGVAFAIIRACYGWDNDRQIDEQLAANVAGCEAQAIPYGFYHYSYAESAQDAQKEARFLQRVIQGYKPSYPVYFDFENAFQLNYTPEKQLTIIEAFLQEMEAAGYFAGLYMSAYPLERLYSYAPDRISRHAVWVAHYTSAAKPSYSGEYGIWQYSSTGTVAGIIGKVDMNRGYTDYPSIIKSAGLNGWTSSQEGQIVQPVICAGCKEKDAQIAAMQDELAVLKARMEKIRTRVGEIVEICG